MTTIPRTSNNVNTPTERFLRLLKGVNSIKSSNKPDPGYTANCPAHHDTRSSLMVWEDEHGHCGIKCFAGCQREAICAAVGLTTDDLRATRPGQKKASAPVLTLIDLAIDKEIHPNDLMHLGLDEGEATFKKKDGSTFTKKGVTIRYAYTDGKPYERTRLRSHVKAKEGSSWSTDHAAPLIPYGLDRLSAAREAGYAVLVEGESDCWTYWLHKIPALGLPGADMVGSTLKMEHLQGINCIYIQQEPDTGGQKFTLDIKAFLDKQGYKGKLYILNLHELYQAKDANDLHKRLRAQGKDAQAFKDAIEQARMRAHEKPLHKERKKPAIQRLCDLQKKELPETRWAIDPILPEGVTILAGKPKLGKSWLALAMLNAISCGGAALGQYPVEQGEVLYISLEDNDKRLKKRSNIVLQNGQASEGFYYATEWARMNEGGYEDLVVWIDEHPHARLICIDTWARFKPKAYGRQNQQYDEDYEALTPLQKLASERGVSILVVDHMRKMESEDPLDMIAGSTGKTGAVDGFLLLYRKRNETDARLFVIGRDIEEEQELLLTFNHHVASWVVKGNVDEEPVAGTPERQAILDLLRNYDHGLTCNEIHEKLGKKSVNTTRNLLVKLRDIDHQVILENNRWKLILRSNCSNHSNHSNCSNHSNTPDSPGEVTMDPPSVTTPYYTPVVTDNPPGNPLVEPSQNGHNPQVTTLTTVTIDVMKEAIRKYGEACNWQAVKGNGYIIPRGKQNWDGFLKWQNSAHPLAYQDILQWSSMREVQA
jgi:AAA domain